MLDRHYNTAHSAGAGYETQCKCGKSGAKHVCYSCATCNTAFPTKEALREHASHFHARALHKCSVCAAEFTSVQHLNRHRVECKLAQSPTATPAEIKCDKCSKTLSSRVQHQKHADNYNSLSHACPVCQVRYCTFVELFKHCWADHHKGNKKKMRYNCPLCPEHFTYYRNYSYHIVDIHEANPNNESQSVDAAPQAKLRKYLYTPQKHMINKKYNSGRWEDGEFKANKEDVEDVVPNSRTSAR